MTMGHGGNSHCCLPLKYLRKKSDTTFIGQQQQIIIFLLKPKSFLFLSVLCEYLHVCIQVLWALYHRKESNKIIIGQQSIVSFFFQSVIREHQRIQEDFKIRQKEDREQLAEKLTDETRKKEEGEGKQFERERTKLLSEKRNKQAAELAARRGDMSDEEAGQVGQLAVLTQTQEESTIYQKFDWGVWNFRTCCLQAWDSSCFSLISDYFALGKNQKNGD